MKRIPFSNRYIRTDMNLTGININSKNAPAVKLQCCWEGGKFKSSQYKLHLEMKIMPK
jgi:hypothetical protein